MRLGSKIKDSVNLIFRHNARNNFRIQNLALDEFESLTTDDGAEIFDNGPRIEDVKPKNANIEILSGHEIANVEPNRTGTSDDRHILRTIMDDVTSLFRTR